MVQHPDEIRPPLRDGIVSRQDYCRCVLSVCQSDTQAIAGSKPGRPNDGFRWLLWPPVCDTDLPDELLERRAPSRKPTPVFFPREQTATGTKVILDALEYRSFQPAVRPLHICQRNPEQGAIVGVVNRRAVS